jgi:hypothetical protein
MPTPREITSQIKVRSISPLTCFTSPSTFAPPHSQTAYQFVLHALIIIHVPVKVKLLPSVPLNLGLSGFRSHFGMLEFCCAMLSLFGLV